MHLYAVSLVKSVFSVWVGLFLVLPSCLCQLLAPFGFALHHHPPGDEFGSAAKCSTPASVVSPAPRSQFEVACVCDSPEMKDSDGDELGQTWAPELDLVPMASVSTADRCSFALRASRRINADRGPPGMRPVPDLLERFGSRLI